MKKNILLLFTFSIALLAASSPLGAQAIIWDLGGVLFQPEKLNMAYHEIGFHNILWHAALDMQNPGNIQRRVFELLYTLGRQSTEYEKKIAHEPAGLELPQIMCDWLLGVKDNTEILDIISTKIDALEKEEFFVSCREKNLLKKTIFTMFNPSILARYMAPAMEAHWLLKEIMLHPHCNQYILSNWDATSFNFLYRSKRGQTIFGYFKPENITISGVCGYMKPHTNIFEHLIAKYNLNPAESVFIDDQLENIKAAHACGLQTIWFNKMTFKELRTQLRKRGFLMNVPVPEPSLQTQL